MTNGTGKHGATTKKPASKKGKKLRPKSPARSWTGRTVRSGPSR